MYGNYNFFYPQIVPLERKSMVEVFSVKRLRYLIMPLRFITGNFCFHLSILQWTE
jgi:hypothetical protein